MMFSAWLLALLMAASTAMADGVESSLQAFVQSAVPEGGIIFSGAVKTGEVTYAIFVLEQKERRGVMVVATNCTDQGARGPQILFADTSITGALDLGLVSPEILTQFCILLGTPRTPANDLQTMATAEDLFPIGAALNTVLIPIVGFSFKSNSTLGILNELEQSDAIPVSPGEAPVGAILICPTTYSATGPVALGAVGIVGSDHKVYGPDVRKGCAWVSQGGLEAWIARMGEKQQLFAFVLRARADRT
jgi:hypothetical protein